MNERIEQDHHALGLRRRTLAPRAALAVACALVSAMALAQARPADRPGGAAATAAAPARNPTEAAALSVVAAGKAKAGEFELCRELFLQAYRLDPAFLGYLYSAARCAQKGRDLDAAERDYRAFLERASADDPLRARAGEHLEEIYALRARQAGGSGVGGSGGQGEGAGVDGAGGQGEGAGVGSSGVGGSGVGGSGGAVNAGAVAPAPAPRPWLAYGLAALGAVGAGVGVAALVKADGDREALRERWQPAAGNSLIWGDGHARARADAADVDGTSRVGLALVGAGVGLAAVGVVLWLRAPSGDAPAAALAPAPGGASLRVAF